MKLCRGQEDTSDAGEREKRKRWAALVRLDKKLSWVLFVVTFLTIVTGYLLTRIESQPVPPSYHVAIKIIFVILLVFHIVVVTVFIRYRWKTQIVRILDSEVSEASVLKLIQRISGILVLIFTGIVVVSGLDYYFNLGEPFSLAGHARFDDWLYLFFTIHMGAGLKVALNRRKVSSGTATVLVFVFLVVLIGVFAAFETGYFMSSTTEAGNRMEIDGESYVFNISGFNQARPDIFREGQYSVFDALVYVCMENNIELSYHFDASADTHVIDSLDGDDAWWYEVYYDGGFLNTRENNYHRMDQYPCKDGTLVRIVKTDPSYAKTAYEIFRTEVARREANDGSVIVPEVIIRGKTFTKTFLNVEVVPHNLRNDTFQDGVITTIDTIMTLGDRGDIEYTLQWYESIGTAEIVNSYWVESIDADASFGRCGFVYENGEYGYEFFRGNHIHLPSDWRVMTSPAYVEYFWICI